jgi:hypothetical protein
MCTAHILIFANHSRAIVDHIEFACRGTAHVDNAATIIRVTINSPLEAQPPP